MLEAWAIVKDGQVVKCSEDILQVFANEADAKSALEDYHEGRRVRRVSIKVHNDLEVDGDVRLTEDYLDFKKGQWATVHRILDEDAVVEIDVKYTEPIVLARIPIQYLEPV